jgi:hypothetical protein
MGGSSSKSSVKMTNNTVAVNETDINYLNKTVNKVSTEAIVENAKSCSASIVQSQQQSYGNIVVGSEGSATLGQNQTAKLDFSCLQEDSVQMDLINKISESLKTQISDKANTAVLNKLSAAVASKSKSDSIGFPWGGSNAESSVDQEVNNYVSNKTKVNVENVIENSTFASFKSKSIQDAIAKVIQSQEIEAGNVTIMQGGTFLSTQEQRATLIVEVIQKAKIGQKVVTDLVKFAGLDLKIEKTVKVENEMEAEATSESIQQGLGSFIGNLLKMFGLAGLLASLPALSPISIGLCCLCCCCCCCLLLLMLLGGGGFAMMGSGTPESPQ